jgi:hypothetical protein
VQSLKLIITGLVYSRILLRYTFLNTEEYETILERLVDRLHKDDPTATGLKIKIKHLQYFPLHKQFEANDIPKVLDSKKTGANIINYGLL